jgi:prepilin-type N-terminal cleavage/methylation domain-containing protein
MKTGSKNSGFTLIEMMLVVAIIVILVSMVVGIAKRIDDQGKERLCRDTIALVGNALEQFRDFGYEYKDTDYAGLAFPLDCNGFIATDIQTTLNNALAATTVISQVEPIHDPNYSGSEVLYFILSQVPDCRPTLDKIDKSLLTNAGTNGAPINITTISGTYPFTRIIDPWSKPLRYDYYPDYADYILANPTKTWTDYIEYRNSAKLTFPVITSAGADKTFGTSDDISNIQKK